MECRMRVIVICGVIDLVAVALFLLMLAVVIP
jgi:hypothetical protein